LAKTNSQSAIRKEELKISLQMTAAKL